MNRPLLDLVVLLALGAAASTGCSREGDPADSLASAPAAAAGRPSISLTLGETVWTPGEEPLPADLLSGRGLALKAWALRGPAVEIWETSRDGGEWTPLSAPAARGEPVILPDWTPGPGAHEVAVRATDRAGRQALVRVPLRVHSGPADCPPEDRSLLVVLDTDPDELERTGLVPADYEARERAWVHRLLEGWNWQVIATRGVAAPSPTLLDCASSVLWIHSADTASGDASVLSRWQREGNGTVARYVESGGNLLLCGIQPAEALRWAGEPDGDRRRLREPLEFGATLEDSRTLPHWLAAVAGIDVVEETVDRRESRRRPMQIARATAAGYPDLPASPRTSRTEPAVGLYDLGIVGRAARGVETLYTADETGDAIGVRRAAGASRGAVVYLGFHPYFFEEDAVKAALSRTLEDFGETRAP